MSSLTANLDANRPNSGLPAQLLYVAPEINESKLKQIRSAGYAVRAELPTPQAEVLALGGSFDVVVIELGVAAGAAEFLAHIGGGLQALRTALVAVGTSTVAGVAFAVPPGASGDLLLNTIRQAVLLNFGRRRRYARITLSATAEVRVGGAQWQAEITDIGPGGLALRCAVTVEVGTPARLSFRLPGTDYILTATGDIRWREGERCGVLFRVIEADGAQQLARWIASRLSGEPLEPEMRTPPRPRAEVVRPRLAALRPRLGDRIVSIGLVVFAFLVLIFWIYMAKQ